MPLTPETLPRHELTGLHVRVVDSDDAGRIGTEGRVVRETTNTLAIRDEGGATRVVAKSGSIFEFAITDDAAGDEKFLGTASKLADTQPESDGDGDRPLAADSDRTGGTAVGCRGVSRDRRRAAGENVAYVTVDGSRLLSRPARRTETRGTSPWQLD